jgi:hypothetical protein
LFSVAPPPVEWKKAFAMAPPVVRRTTCAVAEIAASVPAFSALLPR